MNTNQIKYFLEVAEKGSMLKVAENNYLTQPAVSTAISKLETELGVQLLNRSKHGVTLTAAGKVAQKNFLELQKQLTGLHSELEPFKNHQVDETESTIKLCATLEISNGMLRSVTDDFYKLYPNCAFYIKEYDFWDVINAVGNRYVDFGTFYIIEEILHDIKFQQLMRKYNLCLEEIEHDQLVVGVLNKSPLARKKSISLKTLSQNRIVAYNSSTENCWQKQFLEKYNPDVHLIPTNSLTYCGDLLENREYVVFFLNQKQLLDSPLNFKLLPTKEPVKVTVGIVYRNDTVFDTMTKKFMETFKMYLKNLYSTIE